MCTIHCHLEWMENMHCVHYTLSLGMDGEHSLCVLYTVIWNGWRTITRLTGQALHVLCDFISLNMCTATMLMIIYISTSLHFFFKVLTLGTTNKGVN